MLLEKDEKLSKNLYVNIALIIYIPYKQNLWPWGDSFLCRVFFRGFTLNF